MGSSIKSSEASSNDTTWVELVKAPSENQKIIIWSIQGYNNSGGSALLHYAKEKGGAKYYGGMFNQLDGRVFNNYSNLSASSNTPALMVLDDTDESLMIRLGAAAVTTQVRITAIYTIETSE